MKRSSVKAAVAMFATLSLPLGSFAAAAAGNSPKFSKELPTSNRRIVEPQVRAAEAVEALQARVGDQVEVTWSDRGVPQALYGRITGRAFDAAIPASIVVLSVAIAFAIAVIVFMVIRDQIVESEAVVARHEVHTLFCLTFLVSIDPRAAQDTIGNRCSGIFRASQEIANVVAETAIPFPPTVSDKTADLI